MARTREEMDWYVEMSEMLERRERRRKWMILGVAVAVPLLLMCTGAGAIYLREQGLLEEWFGWAKSTIRPRPKPVEPESYEPVTVEKLQDGDIIYAQLDRTGLITSISHFFRELGPDPNDLAKPFTVIRSGEDEGVVQTYRLKNTGTGEHFEFKDVPVQRVGTAGWVITEQGQEQIKRQLQSQMRAQLSLIKRQ